MITYGLSCPEQKCRYGLSGFDCHEITFMSKSPSSGVSICVFLSMNVNGCHVMYMSIFGIASLL